MEPQSSKLRISPSPYSGLKVLLDARKVTHGGIGVYISNLIAGMIEHGVEPTLIGDPDEIREFDWASRVEVIEDTARPYSIDEMLFMVRRIDLSRYDLFHEPHFTLPVGISIPRVVTIHDLIHITHPERAHYPWVASRLIHSTLRRADRIITVSHATAEDLKRFAGSRPSIVSKIHVIPNAVDPIFHKPGSSQEYVRNRFGLKGKYLLTVSSMLKPHKGVLDLFRVFQKIESLRGDFNLPDCKLVLVGKGAESLVQLEKLINELGSMKSLRLFGAVSKEELYHLYGAAQALVVPSLAEGFCLPVIEAQARGVPVIARPVPAVLELLTKRDLACEDFSESAMADTLIEFLKRVGEDSKVSPLPLQEGQISSHLNRFNRDEISRKTLDLYKLSIQQDTGAPA